MPKTMTKYQLDHFKSKVRRNFDPLIEEQELLVKQYGMQNQRIELGKTVPFLTLSGRRGGSAIAAAAVNALAKNTKT